MGATVEDRVLATGRNVTGSDLLERAGHMRREAADRSALLDLDAGGGAEQQRQHECRKRPDHSDHDMRCAGGPARRDMGAMGGPAGRSPPVWLIVRDVANRFE